MRYRVVEWWWVITFWLSAVQANTEKIFIKFNDKGEWRRSQSVLPNLIGLDASNVHRLVGPLDELMSVKVQNYIHKLPFRQVILISNLTYQESYELKLCIPATTPAEVDLTLIIPSQLDSNSSMKERLDKNLSTSLQELSDSVTDEVYSVGVVLSFYSDLVVVPSDEEKTDIEFIYQIILEPTRLQVLTQVIINMIYLILGCPILGYYVAIPIFNKLIKSEPTDLDHPHED